MNWRKHLYHYHYCDALTSDGERPCDCGRDEAVKRIEAVFSAANEIARTGSAKMHSAEDYDEHCKAMGGLQSALDALEAE